MFTDFYHFHLNSKETFKFDKFQTEQQVRLKIRYKTEEDYKKIVQIANDNFPNHYWNFEAVTRQTLFPHVNSKGTMTSYIIATGNLKGQKNEESN